MRWLIWLIFFCLISLIRAPPKNWSPWSKLELKLFYRYNGKVRPVGKATDTTIVRVTMDIDHIEKVDEKQQTIKIHGWILKSWDDPRLKWDPEEFNSTNFFMLKAMPFPFWRPDLKILNSARDGFDSSSGHAYVWSSGEVVTTEDFSATVACSLSFVRYPFDSHRCQIIFASLMYDGSKLIFLPELNFHLDGVVSGRKTFVGGWKIFNATLTEGTAAITRRGFFAGQGKEAPIVSDPRATVPLLILDIDFERHKPYFVLVEVTPMLMAGALTLSSFWIEAPFLTLAILLFSLLTQGIVSWDLIEELPPATDGMPRILIAYGFNFAMTSTAFLLHVALQYLYHREKTISGYLPPRVVNLVEKAHRSPLLRGTDLRPYSVTKSDSQFVQFPPVEKPEITQSKKVTPLAKRMLFWIFVLIYLIFIIVIAV